MDADTAHATFAIVTVVRENPWARISNPARLPALSWWVLTDKDAAREAVDEGDGVPHVDKIEQCGIRSSWFRISTDPVAALADMLIEPPMHRIDLLAEAFWRDGYSDPNRKIALCQMLLWS